MERDDIVASAAYQPEPTAVAAARRFVRDTLQEWSVADEAAAGSGLVDDAVLLTSELVTNSVVHAGTTVQVVCRLAENEVEVVVADGDPAGLLPEPRTDDGYLPAERTSGRGLLLPAALASAWGVTYGRAAKAVWFRLGLSTENAGDRTDPLPGPDRGLGGGLNGRSADAAVLAAALELIPAPVNGTRARPGAPAVRDRPAPEHAEAEPGYDEMLAATLDSARVAVGADAAYALMIDEDGELRLRAAVGDIPAPAGEPSGHGRAIGGPAAAWTAQSAPSVITVPLVVDGRVTGLLAAVAAVAGRFGEVETIRLQRLADRWGPPLERARLADLEQVRRMRLSALADARGLLGHRVGRDDAMTLAANAAVPRLARWCAVLLQRDKVMRTAFARHCDEAKSASLTWLLDRACRPAGTGGTQAPPVPPPRTATAGGSAWRWPLHTADLDGAPDGAEELAGDDAWCFPLGADGRLGLFLIGRHRHERLPREVAELAADLACRVGVALRGAPRTAARKR